MDVVAETQRLILRKLTLDDAESFYRLNGNPEVVRYTGNKAFDSIESARSFLGNYIDYESHGYGRWAVIHNEDGRFLGWCGLKWHQAGFVDLGYRFFQEEWGHGYATESAQASLDLGFGTFALDEIIGRVAPGNEASIRVLEKLGMTYWKKDICGGFERALYYRISRDAH